jgi:sigma-B regulation protein RsbU (phosphoserine phosphatase)
MNILIAEDERITRMSLARQLQSWGHAVTAAEDGEHAWTLYQQAAFDIVLTDWEMPRLSGVELIHRLRAARAPGYVYVIMLTSRSDKSDVVRGIEAGADDFLTKPFDREELRVRLLAGTRIITLERTLEQQNTELRDANERIHNGLRAAARVQRSMLPQRNVITPRVRTAWNYLPSEELAGDALGIRLLDDRYLVAYIIDVSGHGVPAALLSVSAMHALDPNTGSASLLRDFSGKSALGTVQHPSRVVAELNRRFRAADQDGRYLTMILTVLDTLTGTLHFTSAGHPFPIILRGTDLVPVPEASCFPISIMDESIYEDTRLPLQPGDRVFLYSDGLTEQMSPASNEQFGDDRLLAILQTPSLTSPDHLVKSAAEALTTFATAPTFTDDVSLLSFQYLPPASLTR